MSGRGGSLDFSARIAAINALSMNPKYVRHEAVIDGYKIRMKYYSPVFHRVQNRRGGLMLLSTLIFPGIGDDRSPSLSRSAGKCLGYDRRPFVSAIGTSYLIPRMRRVCPGGCPR